MTIYKWQLSLSYYFLSYFPLVDWSSTPMGIDYVEIGFDMEVQPLVTHNAAWPYAWALFA